MSPPFSIEAVDWRTHEAELSVVRQLVLVNELKIPATAEQDEHDPFAWHWLARDGAGEAVGAVRLLRSGALGRLAVLPEARGQGVGRALLESAIGRARQENLREVFAHVLLEREPLYRELGFQRRGPEFRQHGLRHVTLSRLLREERLLGRDHGKIAADDIGATAAALASQASRHLRLLSHDLAPDYYDNDAFADALSTLARNNRNSEIRLLVSDGKPIAARGHRLLALQRRLSSSIAIRRLSDDPSEIRENYLIVDSLGLLCYPLREPEVAWADFNNRPLAQDYRAQFDELWNRSMEDPELRRLVL